MNVVFWTGIKSHLSRKYGGFDWMDHSKQSWQYWCDKNDVEFVAFEEPYTDINIHRANWQKAIHCWDIMDERGIDADKIFLVDASSMVKWDAPNIFDEVDDRFVGWPDLDNLKWVYDSIEGYKPFFDFDLDNSKYINSGVIIFNKTHRDFFESFKEFYYNNSKALIDLQDNIVRKGTEQTPFNYWLQMQGIELNLDMPVTWKLTHLHRKEMLSYNWQLNGGVDKTPFFIKHGHLWFSTGFEKMQRNNFMTQVWNMIKHNYEA
jgi:hypothetical protein